MAKSKRNLDEVLDELATTVHNLVPGDVGSIDRVLMPIAKSKQQVKALFLEIHLASHDEAGSEAEAMKLFEKKVEEL